MEFALRADEGLVQVGLDGESKVPRSRLSRKDR